MNTLFFIRENAPWLAAGALLTFLSSFGQTFFISVFAGEIRATFGLSHGQWGGIYTLGTTASAALMVWAGGLTDRFRVRALGAVILVLLAWACLFMALNPLVWLLPVVIFALRFTGQGMSTHTAMVAMSRWFVATRGRALSIATLGYSIGEALLPLMFVALLALYDWRLLWVAAALIALLGIPALFALLRHERTPQSFLKSESTQGMEGRHWTRNQAFRHFLFWFMAPAILGPGAFITAFFFHQVHYAEIKSIAHVGLVALFPLYTAVTTLCMIVSGWLIDRFGAARLMPFIQLPMVGAFLCFALAEGIGGIVSGFVLMALTSGAMATMPNAFWAEVYGTGHIGSVKAMIAAVMVLGSAIGPGITGLGIDLGLGISTQFTLVAIYFLLASAMMWIGVTRVRPALAVAP
ncbi:MFS transporter [Alisedimentitalea sp. MJ-SS2]|uniref:MFS transporter n=1 Tax=Aliisedimentitalea sp. MJ-SS2 TaxID=3049795 RepID=UPI00291081AF|nr:MFS transporter [Alisedimentitalea sp. MJ-SS2]MDU8927956.1 MFS transporter [Alisedimentitalea sp. MJ-SS2]